MLHSICKQCFGLYTPYQVKSSIPRKDLNQEEFLALYRSKSYEALHTYIPSLVIVFISNVSSIGALLDVDSVLSSVWRKNIFSKSQFNKRNKQGMDISP